MSVQTWRPIGTTSSQLAIKKLPSLLEMYEFVDNESFASRSKLYRPGPLPVPDGSSWEANKMKDPNSYIAHDALSYLDPLVLSENPNMRIRETTIHYFLLSRYSFRLHIQKVEESNVAETPTLGPAVMSFMDIKMAGSNTFHLPIE